MFLYSVHLHCFLYGWILFEAVLVWIGFLDAYIRKCFSKRNEIACFNNRPGRNFPRFRDSFLTKANRYPIQKACGGGGVSALLRKNVPTFAGKRRHFPWKTCRLPCKTSRTYPADRREDAFRAELQPFFVRNLSWKFPFWSVGKKRIVLANSLWGVRISRLEDIKKAFALFEKQNGILRTLLLALFRTPPPFRPKRRALGVPDEHSVKKSIRGVCRTVKQNYVIY